MKNQFAYLVFAFTLILIGCEGESPIRIRSSAANTDGTREEILAMNQFDLDQCRVQLGSPGAASASFSENQQSGGSINTANTQSDRTEWNSALDKSAQIFGDDEPANIAGNAPDTDINPARESITGVRILSREDIAFARVDIASANSARLITRGTATVTKQIPTRRGGFETQIENTEVDLVYNLINGSRGWLCSSVEAEVRESFDAPNEVSTKKDFGNRIGW